MILYYYYIIQIIRICSIFAAKYPPQNVRTLFGLVAPSVSALKTEAGKYFLQLFQLNQIWIVFTHFRLFWHQAKSFLVPNRFEVCHYNLNRVTIQQDSERTFSQHTEKSFRNLMKSNRNQMVFTILRLIWYQTDVRLI